jgi:hypothetical protein
MSRATFEAASFYVEILYDVAAYRNFQVFLSHFCRKSTSFMKETAVFSVYIDYHSNPRYSVLMHI